MPVPTSAKFSFPGHFFCIFHNGIQHLPIKFPIRSFYSHDIGSWPPWWAKCEQLRIDLYANVGKTLAFADDPHTQLIANVACASGWCAVMVCSKAVVLVAFCASLVSGRSLVGTGGLEEWKKPWFYHDLDGPR